MPKINKKHLIKNIKYNISKGNILIAIQQSIKNLNNTEKLKLIKDKDSPLEFKAKLITALDVQNLEFKNYIPPEYKIIFDEYIKENPGDGYCQLANYYLYNVEHLIFEYIKNIISDKKDCPPILLNKVSKNGCCCYYCEQNLVAWTIDMIVHYEMRPVTVFYDYSIITSGFATDVFEYITRNLEKEYMHSHIKQLLLLAIENYRRAAIDNNNADACCQLGWIYSPNSEGQTSAISIDFLTKAADLNHKLSIQSLGIIYYQLGNSKLALHYLEKVNIIDAKQYIAKIYEMDEKYSEAIKVFARLFHSDRFYAQDIFRIVSLDKSLIKYILKFRRLSYYINNEPNIKSLINKYIGISVTQDNLEKYYMILDKKNSDRLQIWRRTNEKKSKIKCSICLRRKVSAFYHCNCKGKHDWQNRPTKNHDKCKICIDCYINIQKCPFCRYQL